MKKLLKIVSPFNNNQDMSNAVFIVKKLLAFIGTYIVSMILAEGLVIIAHYIMGYNVLQGEMLSTQTMTLLKYYGFIVFMIVGMMYCKFIEKRSLKSMGFNKNFSAYFKGSFIAVVLLGASIGIITFTGNITYHGIYDSIKFPVIFAFLGAFIVQGAMEETLCRGFLMLSLAKRIPVPFAILISTLAFSVPHFFSLFSGNFIYSFLGVINLLLVSIIFSFLVINHHNIWISCGMHSIWNFVLYNVFGLNLSGNEKGNFAIFNFTIKKNNIFNGGKYGIEASLLTAIILLLYALYLIYKYRKTNPSISIK